MLTLIGLLAVIVAAGSVVALVFRRIQSKHN